MAQKISQLTVESMNVELEALTDPTSGTVYFAFVAEDSLPEPADFVAGEWLGEWDIITHIVNAKTPTVGDTGATVELPLGPHHVWIRIDIGNESIVQFVSKLTVV